MTPETSHWNQTSSQKSGVRAMASCQLRRATWVGRCMTGGGWVAHDVCLKIEVARCHKVVFCWKNWLVWKRCGEEARSLRQWLLWGCVCVWWLRRCFWKVQQPNWTTEDTWPNYCLYRSLVMNVGKESTSSPIHRDDRGFRRGGMWHLLTPGKGSVSTVDGFNQNGVSQVGFPWTIIPIPPKRQLDQKHPTTCCVAVQFSGLPTWLKSQQILVVKSGAFCWLEGWRNFLHSASWGSLLYIILCCNARWWVHGFQKIGWVDGFWVELVVFFDPKNLHVCTIRR